MSDRGAAAAGPGSEDRSVTFGDQVRGWLPIRRPALLRVPAEQWVARRLARRYRPQDPPPVRFVSSGLADVLVVMVQTEPYAEGGAGGGCVVLKHGHSRSAVEVLDQEWQILTRLRAEPRLGEWRRLIPAPLERRLDGPLPMIVESSLPGRDAQTVIRADPRAAQRITRLALEQLATLQRATARREPDAATVEAWVARPLNTLHGQVPWCRTAAGTAGLAAVGARLREALAAGTMAAGWTHGDYHPGNLLLDEGATTVTGIVDWGGAEDNGPVAVDACTFVLTLRCLRSGAELGPVVAEILRAGAPDPADAALLAEAGAPGAPGDGGADLALLTWLWHVAANVAKSPRYRQSRIWYRRAVEPVLTEALRSERARSEGARWRAP